MTAAKKIPLNEKASYAIATALHRAKVLAKRQPKPGEFEPVNGKLHVVLTGKPVPRGKEVEVFGESRIVIPEFKDLARE
ncbi:hypothetical protein ASF61_21495 [Duganella sp. Leaf126]|uniref:hypothetical protein n=1 Tax=Duganella sp. Leaf126 TaxID=1736266 RepID=UPI0006FD72B1|nr:hypothetical protein [Duganella sp. Leaf126]KQQ44706.1 hypothetical protein ASF61_21495 [Duganella sp. Leaf126]